MLVYADICFHGHSFSKCELLFTFNQFRNESHKNTMPNPLGAAAKEKDRAAAKDAAKDKDRAYTKG